MPGAIANWNGISSTFDDYIRHVAATPVLFIDDIGQGRYTDRDGNPGLAGTTFEAIADARAANGQPTLYTSNYGPEELRGNDDLLRPFHAISRDRVVRREIIACANTQ